MGPISMPHIPKILCRLSFLTPIAYAFTCPFILKRFLTFHKAGLPPSPFLQKHTSYSDSSLICAAQVLSFSPLNLEPLTRDHPVAHPYVVTFKVFCFVCSICETTTYILNYLLWKKTNTGSLVWGWGWGVCDNFLMNISFSCKKWKHCTIKKKAKRSKMDPELTAPRVLEGSSSVGTHWAAKTPTLQCHSS